MISTTESGHTCQRWDEQEPHNHGYYHDYLHPGDNATLSENYCRNPGREEPGGPWCYTTDAAVRWEYCDIPYCGEWLEANRAYASLNNTRPWPEIKKTTKVLLLVIYKMQKTYSHVSIANLRG